MPKRMNDALSRLPSEPADIVTLPFMRFLRIEAMAGGVLLCSTILALILANSPWSATVLAFWETPVGIRIGALDITRSLKHWINDGLMTLFFFVIALELKRQIVLGELRNPRIAALPIAAAVGGIVAPAGLFLLLIGSEPGGNGWGTVISTDTAFVIGCLAVLSRRVPGSLRLFLLSLAIFDDVGAILIVAIGYGEGMNWLPLGLAALGVATVIGMARLGVRAMPVYSGLGLAIWLAFDASGIHATLAGVVLGLLAPARSWVSDTRLHAILNRVLAYPPGDHWSGDTPARGDLHRAGIAVREALSPIERLEMALHPWVVLIILPLFALANAGVSISTAGFDAPLMIAIIAAFVIGKPAGVVLFSVLAVRLHIGLRPTGLSWRLLAAGSLLTGIGFTMALFIAELAFPADLLSSAKLGILGASILSAAAGFLALTRVTAPRSR